MGGDQHNPVMSKFREQIPETHPFSGIKAAGGLVQNQNLRLVQQRLSNAHTALHAAGQFGDLLATNMGKGQLFQQFVDFPLAILRRQPFQNGNVFQIILNGELGIEPEFLGQVPKDIPVPLPQGRNGNTVIGDLPGGGLHDSGKHPHQRGFSRAVGTQQSPDAGGKLQGNVVHRCHVFEAF